MQASPLSDPSHGHKASTAALTLGALGVVFGDIGTSPLYTLRECLRGGGEALPSSVNTDDVLGILSLIFWSLTMVVTVKYLTFIMRADNKGEGGIFALLAVVPEKLRMKSEHRVSAVALIVVVGAALLYGDGAITPAISVLSAIEGLRDASPALESVVVPLTCVILIALFFVQKRGTGAVGALFGPIMAIWFTTIAALGVYHLIQSPQVLAALSPHYGFRYMVDHGVPGFLVLGSVVLAVTGGEALYADMGHFGKRPIRAAWLAMVMPALVLCYFGQGALVLQDPTTLASPFFAMVPKGTATYLLVALSSAATVIASQALISGAFSLTRQAVDLGYFPRVTIRHTAAHTEGQIYIPEINWILAIGCLLLVLGFQKSERLASAYGIAVTGTMMLTSFVYYVVMRSTWNWPRWVSVLVLVMFASFDVPFFLANTVKILDGGWVPVLIGIGFIAAMLIWSKGRSLIVEEYMRRNALPENALARVEKRIVARVPGTAVFMTSSKDHVPAILLHLVERGRALHSQVIFLTMITETVATIPEEQRIEIRELGNGFHRAVARFGFMEIQDAPKTVAKACACANLTLDPEETTFFLGRESVLATDAGMMGKFAETFYAFLARNAVAADRDFKIPPNQVIEIGIQLDL